MNSENSRTSKPHAIHNLTHKIDLRKGKKKALFYQILVLIRHGQT